MNRSQAVRQGQRCPYKREMDADCLFQHYFFLATLPLDRPCPPSRPPTLPLSALRASRPAQPGMSSDPCSSLPLHHRRARPTAAGRPWQPAGWRGAGCKVARRRRCRDIVEERRRRSGPAPPRPADVARAAALFSTRLGMAGGVGLGEPYQPACKVGWNLTDLGEAAGGDGPPFRTAARFAGIHEERGRLAPPACSAATVDEDGRGETATGDVATGEASQEGDDALRTTRSRCRLDGFGARPYCDGCTRWRHRPRRRCHRRVLPGCHCP